MAAQQYHGMPPYPHHLTSHLGYPPSMSGHMGMGTGTHGYVLPTTISQPGQSIHDLNPSGFGHTGEVFISIFIFLYTWRKM